ncbi:MerR family transcriptional regulator [Microlunatus speluncae]|uniref:MerR family transcriptional regulator n=1 Tax=Microlunatus speluncae TaxID=2594267 RepID=UPI0012666278|nr:MerR family transcriptional regulator [Microlunatus speluncae]
MRIGELSRRSGVSIRALRYYEEKALLRPDRSPSGYRHFGESDLATVQRIRLLLAAGLGTELIAQILACMVDEARMLDGCRDRLLVERARMSADIDQLTTAQSLLDGLLADRAS